MREDFSEPEETEDKDWEWTIKITHVVNGYILEHESEYGQNVKVLIVEPEYVKHDDIPAELQAGRELAYYIWDYFGMHGDKWGKHNLRVRIEPGYKCDGWKPEDGDEDD